MPELLHVSPRSLACDPAVAARVVNWRVVNWRLGRRDFPVEAHRRFQRDQWFAKSNVLGKTFVQLLCFCFEHADIDLSARGPKFGKSSAGYLRIRIFHRADDTANPGGDHRIGTRAGASMMRTWLQIEVKNCTSRLTAGLFEREHFGVLYAGVGVSAGSNFAT